MNLGEKAENIGKFDDAGKKRDSTSKTFFSNFRLFVHSMVKDEGEQCLTRIVSKH